MIIDDDDDDADDDDDYDVKRESNLGLRLSHRWSEWTLAMAFP